MRNLIVTNISSIDGYYEGPDGNVMALPMDRRLIDGAIVLGCGRPTFGASEARLRFESRSLQGSANLLVRYAAQAG